MSIFQNREFQRKCVKMCENRKKFTWKPILNSTLLVIPKFHWQDVVNSLIDYRILLNPPVSDSSNPNLKQIPSGLGKRTFSTYELTNTAVQLFLNDTDVIKSKPLNTNFPEKMKIQLQFALFTFGSVATEEHL